MAINDILEIGRQGLAANRQALQTASNNIANANTPGYSRQRPVFQSAEQSFVQGVKVGGGVEVQKVIRVHDAFVQNQILEESRHFGGFKAKADNLKKLEGALYNESYQISDLVNKFFNDMRELSANPEITSLREHVAASAANASAGFRNLHTSLQSLKADIDGQLEFAVHDVNNLTHQLAELNRKIFEFEASGGIPNELHDRRDQVVRDLSQKLGVQLSSDDRGNVNLNAGGLGILVLGNEARELVLQRTPEEGQKTAGAADLFVKEPGGLRKVTGGIEEGELGGMLHVRDAVINPAVQHLDMAAFQFASSVNDIHREGTGLDGVAGRELFTQLGEVHDAAHYIDLNESVKHNKEAVATGYDTATLSDNRVAIRISELQQQKLMPLNISREAPTEGDGGHTIAESLNFLVANVAMKSQTEGMNLAHQENIMTQLENYRQNISGVSLEEEAVNMMQFQAVFNASAKAMKVGDELFQTILALKN